MRMKQQQVMYNLTSKLNSFVITPLKVRGIVFYMTEKARTILLRSIAEKHN